MFGHGLRRTIGSALLAVAIAPGAAAEPEQTAKADRPYTIRVMREGTEAEIIGEFQPGLMVAFVVSALRSPKLKTVHLTSAGGSVSEAAAIARLIRGRGLDTYVASECYSACTIAFSAGRRRWVADDATLGFHAPIGRAGALSGVTTLWAGSPFGAMAMSYRIAGFSEPFIAKAMATPNAEMWRPSLAELKAAGVVTDVSDGSHFAWSGFAANVSMRPLVESLADANVTLASLRDHDPAAFDRFVQIFDKGYAEAKSGSTVLREFRTAMGRILEEKWLQADDASMVALASLMADEYGALGLKDPWACHRYARGRLGDVGLRALLPAEVWTQHESWQARMIATAKPGAHASDSAGAARRRHGQILKALGRTRAALVEAKSVAPPQSRAFCEAVTAEYRAIARLPEREAGPMMRTILEGFTGDVAAGSNR